MNAKNIRYFLTIAIRIRIHRHFRSQNSYNFVQKKITMRSYVHVAACNSHYSPLPSLHHFRTTIVRMSVWWRRFWACSSLTQEHRSTHTSQIHNARVVKSMRCVVGLPSPCHKPLPFAASAFSCDGRRHSCGRF